MIKQSASSGHEDFAGARIFREQAEGAHNFGTETATALTFAQFSQVRVEDAGALTSDEAI